MNKEDLAHLQKVMDHIDCVRNNCVKLGKALIDSGESHIGLCLIQRGYRHDNSKFAGIEWKYLRAEHTKEDSFRLALENHQASHSHHPEFFSEGIDGMSDLDIAEFVCDTVARSNGFGSDYREWIKGPAAKRFDFSTKGPFYKKIKKYTDLLLDTSFGDKK